MKDLWKTCEKYKKLAALLKYTLKFGLPVKNNVLNLNHSCSKDWTFYSRVPAFIFLHMERWKYKIASIN